jgi:hypothetical protein
MTVQHPHADRDASPAAVTVGTGSYAVDSDGRIDCPAEDEERVARVLARAYGVRPDALIVTETCKSVKTDGEVCGRELPCPYHTEGE